MWVDEQIWGHRLWDSQSPWLIFLEFLTVAESKHRDGTLFDQSAATSGLSFRPSKRLYLRNILYNNEALFQIAERYSDDSTAWGHWLEWINANAQGVPERDFSYLKRRFHSFQQFAALVGMLRSTTIEDGSNKRWSSRFVFPFGRHGIYEDLNVTGKSASREYINFGRPGELLYQMIVRSENADGLRPHFARAFERTDPCDRLLALLQPDRPEDLQHRGDSFLPYASHPAFEALSKDWLAVLQVGLPRFDAYPHLSILGAFHLALYQLEVAALSCQQPRPTYVCEIVAPRKTLVRELSGMSYLQNSQLPARAVEIYVQSVAQAPAWLAAARDPAGFATCRQVMRDLVRWPSDEDDYEGPAEPETLLAELRRAALARHRQHVGNVHRSYGGGAGFVSRRGTNRLRYAPTDDLLKALILANVPVRMEYGEFLSVLFDRYGIVIGEREARTALSQEEFDKRAFQNNSDRLESRLRTLGMLRKLSDACAYVENPLRRIDA
jgi:hypothetical protein